jgi:prolyl-tRNA synthetase
LTKETVELNSLVDKVDGLMVEIQEALFSKALDFRNSHITEANNFEEFKTILETKTGFISAHWDGTSETEQKIKELTKATIRCIPFDGNKEAGTCVFTGNPSNGRVLFAKAY